MADANYLILEGRLVKDAELSDKNRTKISRFSIATNGFRKGADGGYEDKVDFFPLAIFGTYAEKMTPFLTKERKITILGSVSQDTYEKDGTKHSSTVIKVREINLGQTPGTKKDEPDEAYYEDPDMYHEDYGA